MTTSTAIRRHANSSMAGKKVLYIVSNPATLMGFPVGFFAEEMTGPFFDLMRAGCTVDIASPKGGKVAFDGLELFMFQDPVYRPNPVRPFRMPERGQMVEIAGMMQEKR